MLTDVEIALIDSLKGLENSNTDRPGVLANVKSGIPVEPSKQFVSKLYKFAKKKDFSALATLIFQTQSLYSKLSPKQLTTLAEFQQGTAYVFFDKANKKLRSHMGKDHPVNAAFAAKVAVLCSVRSGTGGLLNRCETTLRDGNAGFLSFTSCPALTCKDTVNKS